MDALLGERAISFKALADFSKLERSTKAHLKNVYSSLAVAGFSAALGSAVHVFFNFVKGGMLSGLGSIGFIIALALTSNEPKNQMKRFGFLMGMAFCSGLSLGPLIDHVIDIDPSIVMTAFMATSLIFVCFTLSALWAEDRSYLYLGGTLMSTMSCLCIMGLMNIFFRSQMMFQIQLYLGLVVFCAFILYDTQLIIEKRRRGDTDFIWHSVDLFLDFINIFRRIMIIMANNKEKKSKRKE